MDTEAAAPLRDVHQPLHEVGQVTHHRRELVDDDEQARHRQAARARLPLQQIHVVLDVLGARLREEVLPPGQFRGEGDQGPFHEMSVQVGHHADGVRQPDTVLERGAALVVDQDERHRVRPVRHGQGGHERLEQLGLAGAGRPGDKTVRAVPAQIQEERPVHADPDGGTGGTPARLPACPDVTGPRRVQGQHVQQPRGAGQYGRLLVRAARVTQRTHGPGQGAAPVEGDEVGPDAGDRARPGTARPQRATGLLGDDGLALLGQQPLLGVQAERTDTDTGPVPEDPHDAGQRAQPPGPVEDDEHIGALDGVPLVLLRAALRDQCCQLRDPARRRLRSRADAGRRVTRLLPHMRQPAHPRPALPVRRTTRRQQMDLKVTRAVQDGCLSDGPPRHRLRGRPRHRRYPAHRARAAER